MSYASEIGARPATRAEKEAAGFKGSTRAYTLPDGTVLSHRRIQTAGLTRRYSLLRPTLESRAAYRAEQGIGGYGAHGEKTARSVADNIVRHAATAPVSRGGMGLTYDKRTRRYVNPRTGEAFTFQELRRGEDMQDPERGIWRQWKAIKKVRNPIKRRNMQSAFLKRYGLLRKIGGHWRYVG